MKHVAIIDYGMGNLDSVARAVEVCGGKPMVTDQPTDLATADCIILPGVGAFGDGMAQLRSLGFDQGLRDEVLGNRIPLLGICLGMQLLASKGFESGETDGLGYIAGEVRRFEPDTPETRIPHVGWNEVYPERPLPLFEGIPEGRDFYFVHSYHFCPKSTGAIAAYTPYCGRFVSCVNVGNIYGVQFHPEKSQRLGLQLLTNFLGDMC
jgi:imidazole glycerol-phosphate synthase subunit HisH